MNSMTLALIAVAILVFGLVSRRSQKSPVSAPMVFVACGFLLGPHGFGLADLRIENEVVHLLAELTLILVLFTDASRIDLKLLRREHNVPVRMLAIGLPLTVVLGLAAAVALFPGLTFWECAVLAAVLAPTDAALGQAVVSSRLVPVRIRQALNVESGLNDGLALPLVLILVSLGCGTGEGEALSYWTWFAAKQVILGPLVGVAVALVGGKLIERATRTGWMTHTFQALSAIGLALLAFALAEMIHGNGFIAAFCAGLAMGNASRAVCPCLYEFAEEQGQLLTLLVFLVFGAMAVPAVIDHAGIVVWLYALLSLTVIRMLPVALSLWGTGLKPYSVAFLGWFGPRGLASMLFALLVLEEAALPGREEVVLVVMTTVLLSIFLHGASAYPAATRYARRAQQRKDTDAAEHLPVSEMPVRLSEEGLRSQG